MIGLIKPEHTHRINDVHRKGSYSLWIRFKKIADVQLIGKG